MSTSPTREPSSSAPPASPAATPHPGTITHAPATTSDGSGGLPFATLLLGCAAFFCFASFAWLPLVLGVCAVVAAVVSRGRITGPRDAAMTAIGAALGLTACILSWMSPGFHTIVWGN